MRFRALCWVLLLASVVGSCATKRRLPKVGTDPLLRERRDNTPVDDEAPMGKLPEDVIPLEYDLNLVVDPRKQVFSGFAAIGVRLTRPRSHLWLHGVGLQVKQAQITLADGGTRRVDYQQLTPGGVVRLSFRSQLEPQDIRLVLGYDAEISRSLQGVFRVEEDGRPYVFTQFQATDARRAFPCFDEPRFKTPFRITLTIPAEMKAIATTSVEAQRMSSDGSVRTLAFRESARLPTYLVAFAVGELDMVETEIPPNATRSRPIPLRGVTVKGKADQIRYALETTPVLLDALESYTGIAYPYEKIDLVAVPDFSAGGMENVGVITFREWLVLLEGENAPREQRQRFALVLAHELAHQWFGNLVTHAWWDDLWLNEALAEWLGARIASQWDGGLGLDSTLQHSAQSAMKLDSLVTGRAIREPIDGTREIENAFDASTYFKGGAVIAMFERFVGPERFRVALGEYLRRFANRVADASDFLSTVSESAEVDIEAALSSFLNQPGVPTLNGRLLCEGGVGRFDLRQTRYAPVGSRVERNAQWQIPVCVASSVDDARDTQCRLMTDRELSLDFDACPDWVMPNADAAGYYRFTLDEKATRALVAAAGALTVPERVSLLDSLEAALYSGELEPSTFFEMLRRLADDPDRSVVERIVSVLRDARRGLVSERGPIDRYTRELFATRARKLGLERRPSDDPDVIGLRTALWDLLVFDARDPRAREAAALRGLAVVGNEGFAVPDTLRDVEPILLGAALLKNGRSVFDRYVAMLGQSSDSRLRRSILSAIGRVESPELQERARDLVLSESLRDNERSSLLLALADDPESARGSWLWLRANYRALSKRLSPGDQGRTTFVARRLCREEDLASIDEFFADRVDRLRGGPRNLVLTLEQVELCIASRRALTPKVERYFGSDEVAYFRTR